MYYRFNARNIFRKQRNQLLLAIKLSARYDRRHNVARRGYAHHNMAKLAAFLCFIECRYAIFIRPSFHGILNRNSRAVLYHAVVCRYKPMAVKCIKAELYPAVNLRCGKACLVAIPPNIRRSYRHTDFDALKTAYTLKRVRDMAALYIKLVFIIHMLKRTPAAKPGIFAFGCYSMFTRRHNLNEFTYSIILRCLYYVCFYHLAVDGASDKNDKPLISAHALSFRTKRVDVKLYIVVLFNRYDFVHNQNLDKTSLLKS